MPLLMYGIKDYVSITIFTERLQRSIKGDKTHSFENLY
jgi:hypothetical protein